MAMEKKVLIIDDDLGFTYLLQKILGECGIVASNLTSVTSATEATKYIVGLHPYLSRKTPDLIFLDLKMDGMDGFGFLEWARLDPYGREIPVVVITGAQVPGDREKAMALGAMGLYEKAADPAKLRDNVQSALRKCFGNFLEKTSKINHSTPIAKYVD